MCVLLESVHTTWGKQHVLPSRLERVYLQSYRLQAKVEETPIERGDLASRVIRTYGK